MTCAYCHSESGKFCSHCGAALSQTTAGSLLAHIKRGLAASDRDIARMRARIERGDDYYQKWLPRREAQNKRWHDWAAWIEAQIKEGKAVPPC